MSRVGVEMTVRMAREVLGVSSLSTPDEVKEAFREAAKRAHPDQGGDEAVFRQVVEAYRRLQNPFEESFGRLPVVAEPEAPAEPTLEIDPLTALNGGETRRATREGRTLRVALPAGLRSGDRIRAGGVTFKIYVRAVDGVLVRGDDLWMTVHVAPSLLRKGGRVTVATPLGDRSVWIDRKASDRGLVRVEGEGLPARGRHLRGDLFLRLAPQAGEADSAAMTLLRRFAAAWAA